MFVHVYAGIFFRPIHASGRDRRALAQHYVHHGAEPYFCDWRNLTVFSHLEEVKENG